MVMRLLFLLLLSPLCPPLLGDGYPFDPGTQRVMVPSLRLKLDTEQVQEISATGILTFSEGHLRLLRAFYPVVSARTDVIAATFNDNHEGLAAENVYCLWVAPDEVAVTLNETHPKNQSPFHVGKVGVPADEEQKEGHVRSVRVGPEGDIYFRGKPIVLPQVFILMDEMAGMGKPQAAGQAPAQLRVVVAPPQAKPASPDAAGQQPDACQIYDLLVAYGASKSIEVSRDW